MFHYVLKGMLRRSSRNILLLVGLLAVSSGLSTYVAANQNASVRVSTALDEHWRGAYDILVRPHDAVQPTERQYGLVESNYLNAVEHGITVQQWKEIEKLQDVEVAAPVSTIGYLRNTIGNVALNTPPQTEPSLYRFSMTITSTNGYREAGINTYLKYLPLGPPPPGMAGITGPTTDAQTDELVRSVNLTEVPQFATFLPDGSAIFQVASPPIIWTLVAGIDPSAERRLTGLDTAIVERNYLADNDGITTVGVGGNTLGSKPDPLDLSQDVRNRRLNPHGPDIPIIYASSTYINLPTTVRVDKLEMLDAQTLARLRELLHQVYIDVNSPDAKIDPRRNPKEEAQTRFLENLRQPVLQTLVDSSFNFGDVLKPMSERAIAISMYAGQAPVQTNPDVHMYATGGLEKSYEPGAITYEAHTASFDAGGLLTLAAVPKVDAQTIISMTGETAFRSLAPSTPALLKADWDAWAAGTIRRNKSPYTFHETGTYDLSKLPDHIKNPDPLTYVPLGIYQPPMATLVRDADGKPLPGGPVPLKPTINPASFIPGPPLAFTNIASARFFRGEKCIDAIRVRVAGIDRYTPENVAKVEDVATRIIQATGLHVDIVAGSSPQKVLVYIPGSPDGKVAPLGYVEEPWTTLGAAAAISSGIDRASVFMLGAVGIAGLLYLISQSLLSTLAQRRELALLAAVGWRRKHIALVILGEASILGVLGGLCATVLAVLTALSIGLMARPVEAVGVGVSVLVLYILASIGPAMWIVRQPVADLLQRGEVASPLSSGRLFARSGKGARRATSAPKSGSFLKGAGLQGLVYLAWRNLMRRRARTFLAITGVAIATVLLIVLSAALLALGGALQVTLLGQFMSLQVQPYHFIMVGSALAVGVLTVADHLAMGVLERRHELALLQAIGWRRRTVQASILVEGAILGLSGGLAAAIVILGGSIVLRNNYVLSAWWVVPAGVLLVLVLCLCSALYAVRLAPKYGLVRVLS